MECIISLRHKMAISTVHYNLELEKTLGRNSNCTSIMPSKYQLAVETYVSPMDFPLISKGNTFVYGLMDGQQSFSRMARFILYGTYGGKIVAVENFISDNGKYRVLIAPDERKKIGQTIKHWLRAQTIALLENVPIWYEIWRTLNGFPPNYYQSKTDKNATKKKINHLLKWTILLCFI